MNKVPKADLQRWSEEVARDPAAPAFIPLAQSYRRRGQLDAAIQLCVRALARHPAHIDGHALLAQLYLELGDHERAGDEWSIVLRLDPDHFEAHRGLGFFWLERGRHEDAERHLVEAAAIRPDDAAVLGALALIDGGSARDEEVGSAPGPLGGGKGADGEGEVAAPPPPGQVFESLLKDPACNGALVLDAHGLILAGGLRRGGQGSAETLAALLGGVLAEASRALGPAGLGTCQGILLETPESIFHLAPLGEELTILILAAPHTPPGWISRLARHAAAAGSHLLETAS